MTEVEICGGGNRIRINNQLVSMGCPPPPYIKESRRGGSALSMARPRGGVLLPVGVGFPPSLVGVGEEGRGRGREGKGGRPPSQFGLGLGGAPPPWPPPPLFHHGPLRPINPPGGSGNPSVLRKMPKPLGTFPVSKHSLPIYQSLCLDHFETSRHVRDHIQDSEQPSVHQNT